MKAIRLILLILLLTSPSYAQIFGGGGGPAKKVVTGATLPATCNVGDVYYKTGATAGLYNCSASNTWTYTSATVTKSSLGLGSVENTALSTWAGTANVTTIGTLPGPLNVTSNLTAALDTKAINITGTWNTSGTPSLIYADITQTSANASSLYIDIRKGGVNLFKLRQDGRVDISGDIFSTNGNLNGGAAIVNEIRANAGTEVRVGAYGLTGFKICATASNCGTESGVWAHTTGIYTGTARLVAATGNETAFTLDYTTNKATSGDDKGLVIAWHNTLSPGTSTPFEIDIVGTGSIFNINEAGMIVQAGVVFSALGTPANGTMVYCSDCQIANPCADTGSGAFAKRLNGAWVCN